LSNTKPTVLITSAGRKVWLVRAFQKAGAHVTACDVDSYAPALYIANEKIIGNRKNLKRYSAIVPTRDAELLPFSKEFSNAIVSHPVSITKTHKLIFPFFSTNDPIKEYIASGNSSAKMFLKPENGSGSRGSYSIDIPKNYIVQEFIDWPEYTIDVFIHPNGTQISAVPRSRLKVINGESWTSKTVKCKDLIDASLDLCSKIGLIWHTTVQAFYNGKDIKFIEVMNRFGGGAPLSFAAGANSPKWIVDILNGKKVKPCIGEFKDGLTMLKFTEEIFI
jgi:carbamoyl-phosphate synthase large subunit